MRYIVEVCCLCCVLLELEREWGAMVWVALSLSLFFFFSFSNFDPANTLLNDPIIRDTPRDTKSGATV